MDRRGRPDLLLLLLVAAACWLAVVPAPAQVRHPLPVLWMMPSSSGGNETAGAAAAVRLALQDLEKQPPPLGNYEIRLQLLDLQCDAPAGLKALFDAMWAGPKYLMVLGEVCPAVTALTARALPFFSLAQVSFAASPPGMSNRKWYGSVFSTVPSDRAVNQATVKLLRRFQWTRVGVVTRPGARLSEMKKDLIRQLAAADVEVVSSESLTDDVCSGLTSMKDRDVRVIIGRFEDAAAAAEVFCCAHRLNLFGPRHQWIVAAGGAAGWSSEPPASGCASDQLAAAADGSIRLQIRRLSSSDAAGISGRTPQDYQGAYRSLLLRQGSKVDPLHAYAYDAVWVAARALSQTMEAVRRQEKQRAGRNGTVGEEERRKTLLAAVRLTRFEGVTGPVFFRNGERMASIELIQSQDGVGELVGEFNTVTQQLRLISRHLKFKGSGPARDRTRVRLQRRGVGLLLVALASSAAAATIAIALTVLCFVLVNHKRWYSRGSGSGSRSGSGSPPASSRDELLLLGVLLSSSSVLVSGLDEVSLSEWTLELLCSVRLWILSAGQTLGFSVLLAKTWRVYSLCSIQQQQQYRTPPAGRVLLCFSLLDALVLASWQTLDPPRRVVTQHGAESDPADQDVLIRPFSAHCSSVNMDQWLAAVCAYKGPLLGLGCFLAWNIRTVDAGHPAADGGRLPLSMFAVTASASLGASAWLLAPGDPPVHFCASSALILGCNVLILGWLFAPKVFHLCCGGGGELQSDAEDGDEEQLRHLNKLLRSQTAQLDAEMEAVSAQLRETSELLRRATADANGADLGSATHLAQVCADNGNPERRSPDGINAPELVRRRLSLQLPILHHSYLPAIGGVSASSSRLFGSRDALMTPSCPPQREARRC